MQKGVKETKLEIVTAKGKQYVVFFQVRKTFK